MLQPANIMFDRRVVRGNTYAAQILPAEPPSMAQAPVRPRRRKPAARKLTTPPPVHGRHHIEMQTDSYLEELVDVLPEQHADTQTDTFLDRPITPLFIPQKRGVDAETQIDNGDLFDFNLEVEPLLEVIVGKTLEQGLMEVLHWILLQDWIWLQHWSMSQHWKAAIMFRQAATQCCRSSKRRSLLP